MTPHSIARWQIDKKKAINLDSESVWHQLTRRLVQTSEEPLPQVITRPAAEPNHYLSALPKKYRVAGGCLLGNGP